MTISATKLSAFVLAVALTTGTGTAQRDQSVPWAVGATTRRFVPQGSYNWRGAATHAPQSGTTRRQRPRVRRRSSDRWNAPLFTLGEWAPEAAAASGSRIREAYT